MEWFPPRAEDDPTEVHLNLGGHSSEKSTVVQPKENQKSLMKY